jgi:double-stranded uracil-DNA glycosylase
MTRVRSSAVRRPTRADLEAAHGRTIHDCLAEGLDVLFVGINPSLYSAATGHHFARPGNRFWKALHGSGFTDRLLTAQEDGELPRFGLGLTNLVARATARADELTPEELRQGGRTLTRKVRRWSPAWVAVVGVTAYRVAFDRSQARVGRQDETIADRPVWVLPNPSGLNAHYQLPDLIEAFAALRAACRR